MTKAGLESARAHAQTLPSYSTLEEAERALFAQRDRLLEQLRAASARSASFRCDFTPESLKALERWYFELHEVDGFGDLGLDREMFERGMAMYCGEVIVRNHPEFRWVVRPFVFVAGKYEIGVDRGQMAVMLSRFRDVHARRNNKKRESIWRDYRRWVG